MNFTNTLILWYLSKKRDLPWRNTTDPYFIWLSEIILQQTRVAQGKPYYLKFVQAFPTVFDLASADEEQVLKLWQGLGYYSRARNLHATARIIASDFNGIFPGNYNKLLKLKGIGSYTAAAIASFSFDEAVPAIDGNVFRVLARFFDIETDIALPKARKEFAALANELIPKDNPAIFNQAMIEFGAIQCIPRNPPCEICPMKWGCLALKKRKVNMLPVKSRKAKPTIRHLNYIIAVDPNYRTLIRKRTGKGIWQNLYEFPVIETEDSVDVIDLVALSNLFPGQDTYPIYLYDNSAIVHKLTHQTLHIKFWKVSISGSLEGGKNLEEIMKLPFPIVIFNFLESLGKRF